MIAKLSLALLSLLCTLCAGELALRLLPAPETAFTTAESDLRADTLSQYTTEELDRNLPLYQPHQGASAVHRLDGSSFSYHPYYGFNTAQLLPGVAQELLKNRRSVVFLGGSVMQNTHAPNYKTTIDSAVHTLIPGLHSINLAESGARSTNEMIRFVLEVADLKPCTAVFLDGFNEFNAVRYGGSPEHDFYWTAGVRDRVHAPQLFLVDKVISLSRVLQLALWKTGLVASARAPRGKPSAEGAERAAQLYGSNVIKTRLLCDALGIKCFFYLQPTLFMKPRPSAAESRYLHETSTVYPGAADVVLQGYRSLRTIPGVIDLSDLGNELTHSTFTDMVHLGKELNQRIGAAIARDLAPALKRCETKAEL